VGCSTVNQGERCISTIRVIGESDGCKIYRYTDPTYIHYITMCDGVVVDHFNMFNGSDDCECVLNSEALSY